MTPLADPGLLPYENGRSDVRRGYVAASTAEQTFPSKNPAGASFDFKGRDRHIVKEQSFLLPDDEILTVLTLPNQAFAR